MRKYDHHINAWEPIRFAEKGWGMVCLWVNGWKSACRHYSDLRSPPGRDEVLNFTLKPDIFWKFESAGRATRAEWGGETQSRFRLFPAPSPRDTIGSNSDLHSSTHSHTSLSALLFLAVPSLSCATLTFPAWPLCPTQTRAQERRQWWQSTWRPGLIFLDLLLAYTLSYHGRSFMFCSAHGIFFCSTFSLYLLVLQQSWSQMRVINPSHAAPLPRSLRYPTMGVVANLP